MTMYSTLIHRNSKYTTLHIDFYTIPSNLASVMRYTYSNERDLFQSTGKCRDHTQRVHAT